MIQFVDEDENELSIYAEDQSWDDETLKELEDEHTVFFMNNGDGVIPVLYYNLKNYQGEDAPAFAFGGEDDGHMWFKKRDGYNDFVVRAGIDWIDDLIADLTKLRDYVKIHPKAKTTLDLRKEYGE